MKSRFAVLACALALVGCARSEVTRVSANSMLIDTGAAPACGPAGAAKVAAKTAAVETLRAGFSRYIIVGAASQNNVREVALPGQYHTTGRHIGGGTYQFRTQYIGGGTISAGSHDRRLAVVMYKPGDAGFSNAVDAKQELGPTWEEIVKNGVRTCL